MEKTILSDFIFEEGNLFVRTDGVVNGSIFLKKGQEASFDTYFNSLSCKPFSLFTDVRKCFCMIDIDGKAETEIRNYTANDDLVIATSLSGGEKTIISFDMPTDGIVYLVVKAKEDVKINSVSFYVEGKVKDIKIAVAICTFQREEFVINNVKKMTEYKAQAYTDYEIFVVDNGQTLRQEDVNGAKLIPNKNLGGSGGFTRGIMEAYNDGSFSHILVMDDDITFFPQIIDRMGAFLSLVVRGNVAAGGGMLRLDKKEFLHEIGGLWDGDRICGLYKNLDVSEKKNVIFDNNKADYSAWWCCCFPTDTVAKRGLPMPFFIKNDDVEYGVRGGFDWAFLNGVAVWHEPFDKKYSYFLEYYIKRNELITNCITRQRRGLGQYFKLVRSVMWQIILQRYFTLPYLFMAYDDFFRGADYFSEIDGEKLNKKLLDMRTLKTYSGNELRALGYDLDRMSYGKKVNKFIVIVTLNGQLIPTPFYKKRGKDYVVTDVTKGIYGDTFMQKTVVQYNPGSDTGFVTTLRRRELFCAVGKLIKYAFKFIFRYRKVRADYLNKKGYITSFEAWNKRLFSH